MMLLTDRDYVILREINRRRFLLGRHIKELIDFTGARACDRRLRVLIESGYIERVKVLYGVPGFYRLTHKGKMLLGVNARKDKIRVERIPHDITVADASIYLINKYNLSLSDITTEKELYSKSGFSDRKHFPDFVFLHENKKNCVEVELSVKAKKRFMEILKNNYTSYDSQIWIMPKNEVRNKEIIKKSGFTDISVLDCEVVTDYIRRK